MVHVRLLPGALLVLPVALMGCSSGNPHAPARISGSLSYKGQPIKGGSMQLFTPEGVAYAAKISSDGTYSATDIPTGELIITVETESINPVRISPKGSQARARMEQMNQSQRRPGGGDGGGAAEDPSVHYIKLPAKYANPKTSPLTVTVKAGRQVHNVELTD